MKPEYVVQEWNACRESIGRFDNYLLQLRVLGFSVITVVFGALSAAAGSDKVKTFVTPNALLFVLAALYVYVIAIYILDRYYERMLAVAVLRASRLEALSLRGYRLGLTTEIQFQKERIGRLRGRAGLLKASSMVNLVYILIFIGIALQFGVFARPIVGGLTYGFSLLSIVLIAALLLAWAHFVLRHPSRLISERAEIVESPVIMTSAEIKFTIFRLTRQIAYWLKERGVGELHIVSVVWGARPFTEDLVSELSKHTDLAIFVHLVAVPHKRSEGAPLPRQPANPGFEDLAYGVLDKANLAGKYVLIVDDLLESGETLKEVRQRVDDTGANEVKTAVLVRKFTDGEIDEPNFLGLDMGLKRVELEEKGIADYWLFGYGMDLHSLYREIDHIGAIKSMAKPPPNGNQPSGSVP